MDNASVNAVIIDIKIAVIIDYKCLKQSFPDFRNTRFFDDEHNKEF